MTERLKQWLRSPLAAIFVVSTAVTIFYGPLFGGYWLGDDFVNLLISHDLAQDGKLLSGALDYFTKGTSVAGSMYRPLQMATLLGNYAIAGDYYPGWFAVNFALHLANAILVFYVVRALAEYLEPDAQPLPVLVPLLAALLFALAPPLAEGVFWVSARADACVTLLSLLSLLAWVVSAKPQQGRAVWWFPGLLVPALLIKESAAILPLQMALVTTALWPAMRRHHFTALSISVLLTGCFFLLRWSLFGHALGVYAAPGSASPSVPLSSLWAALQSVYPWWRALSHNTPGVAAAYLILLSVMTVWLCAWLRGAQARVALALFGATCGLMLATLINLGGLAASGEGGRLTYGPICWLMVAMGAAMVPTIRSARRVYVPQALAVAVLVCGAVALHSINRQVSEAQATTLSIARGIADWAANHEGHAMLVMPEMVSFVVATRNAQGGLVMPPVQARGLLHHVIPTLENELPMRYAQYHRGIATRLASEQPTRADLATMERMLAPATVSWPQFFLCVSAKRREILPLSLPRTLNAELWQQDIRSSLYSSCAQ